MKKKVKKKKTLFRHAKKAEKPSVIPEEIRPEIQEEDIIPQEEIIQAEETAESVPQIKQEILTEEPEETEVQTAEETADEELSDSYTAEAEGAGDDSWRTYLDADREESDSPDDAETWEEYLEKNREEPRAADTETWEEYTLSHESASEDSPAAETDSMAENTVSEETADAVKKPEKKGRIQGKRKIAAILAGVMVLSCAVSAFGYTSMKNRSEELERQKFEAVAKKGKKVNVGSELRQRTTKEVKKQKDIPAYSLSQIRSMDMSKKSGVTAADLKLVTSQGLVGLEQAFVNAENRYNVNALFLVAIASLESANGTICFRPNNMFGYGSSGYPSKEACIYDVASGLGNNYLRPGGSLYSGKTISDVNKRYASSSTWDEKVSNNMYKYYSVISRRRRNALKNL